MRLSGTWLVVHGFLDASIFGGFCPVSFGFSQVSSGFYLALVLVKLDRNPVSLHVLYPVFSGFYPALEFCGLVLPGARETWDETHGGRYQTVYKWYLRKKLGLSEQTVLHPVSFVWEKNDSLVKRTYWIWQHRETDWINTLAGNDFNMLFTFG